MHPATPGFFDQDISREKLVGIALLVLAASPAFSQDALEPKFDLIGDVQQKFTVSAADWDARRTTAWAFTSDLKPKFSYGPLTFEADSTWTLPMTARLAAESVKVAVPEAYFRVAAAEGLDLTFGQKRFAIGVGQTFTVGDSLNPVIGFFDQKTGFRGATAEWSPVSWASVSAATSTEKKGVEEGVTGAAQASFLLDQLQLTVSGVYRPDVTFNPAVGLSYDVLGVIVTAEGAAEFLPQGLRPEGLADTWKVPDAWSHPALSGSLGARWTPSIGDWDLTLSGEYLHWAQGWNADETDAWKAALAGQGAGIALPAREALPLRSQENAFFRVILSTGGVFSVNTFAAVDLQDASVLAQGAVTWTPWDNVDFSATLQTAHGDRGDAWEFVNANQDLYQLWFATTYHF